MHTFFAAQLTKTFGNKKILDNTGFYLKSGEIMSIFGRNGCGKSTLLKILFGTEKAAYMQLEYNGKPIRPSDVIPRQIISYLPQDPFLPKHLKVRDIIPLYFPDSDGQDSIFYAPNIHKIANTPTGKLSLGELRFFELLLIANLPHPFLMLDEPFSMVEPLYKEKIKELLQSISHKKGIIVTDHYYRDVLDISTHNLLLKDGQLLEINSVADLATHGYINKTDNS